MFEAIGQERQQEDRHTSANFAEKQHQPHLKKKVIIRPDGINFVFPVSRG